MYNMINKKEELYNDKDINTFLSNKTKILFNIPKLKKIINSNNQYDEYTSKFLIYNFIKCMFFYEVFNLDFKLEDETLKFILKNKIDLIIIDNFHIFLEDNTDFIKQCKKRLKKLYNG